MLRTADRDGLAIREFVFHRIDKDRPEPEYLDEVELTEEQTEFFRTWLGDAIKKGVEYEFIDRDAEGSVFSSALKMCAGDVETFVEISKVLSGQFRELHTGNTSNGILVWSSVQVPSGSLLILVKMDFQKIFSMTIDRSGGRARGRLTTAQNPISEDSHAIQKVAIININANYEWDVLAQDKQNNVSYKIADFFKDFLGVREREVASQLTRRVHALVSQWANEQKQHLDPNKLISDYRGRAIDYLNHHAAFDEQTFISAVASDSNALRNRLLTESLRRKLVEADLAGRTFNIRPGSLSTAERRTTWRTNTGVQISFEGESSRHNIERQVEGDEQLIIIRAASIRES